MKFSFWDIFGLILLVFACAGAVGGFMYLIRVLSS